MGHTIHLFLPETWGFHIDLVTEDNVVAPLSMKVSLHGLRIVLLYMMFFSLLFSHTWQRKASHYCPAIEEALFDYSQPVSYQALEHNYAFLWNIPFHNQTPDFQLIKNCSADQGVTHVVAWQCLKTRQPFFLSLLASRQWPLVDWRGRMSWVRICSVTYSI